jgi:mRNA interferase MazF
MELTQYSIVLVNLDPTIGSEMKKVRPCVILSPDEMNRNLRTVIIAPMTSKLKGYPTCVPVVHQDKNGEVALDQVRTIDRLRIIRVLDVLKESEIAKVKDILFQIFVG